ncbi:MAG TPA: response regulator transcription factor [Aliidongia sp.]|uniref:response regulator transcription factor n=1 Tax=Aliidongia sp. TaxID=1914230 RepID=UPI002DDD6337|nr:response regulator transcription factor [Aliidongia sp.]HEV2677438.1 response regulator transcription factor [Aliidongia sp.]
MKKIVIADDHPMIRGALALSLAATTAFGKIEVLETSTLAELLAYLNDSGEADLVLLDLRMPGVNGFEGLLTLRARFPSTPVVIISALEDPQLVAEALALGAAGFIPKSTPRHEIVRALNLVAAGEVYAPPHLDCPLTSEAGRVDAELAQRLTSLTPQQRRVLQLLGTGKLNKEIAYDLAIAETTVKAHVSSILHKLNVYSRTQAVVMAGRLHLSSFADIAEV